MVYISTIKEKEIRNISGTNMPNDVDYLYHNLYRRPGIINIKSRIICSVIKWIIKMEGIK